MEKNMPKAEKLNIWPKLNTNPKSTKITFFGNLGYS